MNKKVMAKGQVKQKRTEENMKKLLIAIQEGQSPESACAKVGISYPTFIDWKKTDPNFLIQIEAAKEFWLSIVHDKKNKLIKKEYRPAIEKELKSKDRAVYGDKSEVSNTNVDITDTLTEDQKKKLAERMNLDE